MTPILITSIDILSIIKNMFKSLKLTVRREFCQIGKNHLFHVL